MTIQLTVVVVICTLDKVFSIVYLTTLQPMKQPFLVIMAGVVERLVVLFIVIAAMLEVDRINISKF